MKVVLVPVHVGLLPPVNAILTAGEDDDEMVIVIAFEVAVLGLAHAAEEVITHVTTCPFVSAEVV